MARQSKFSDMANGVEASLDYMRRCEREVKDAEVKLANKQSELEEARAEFNDAREAFHKEFPEMAPASVAVADVQASPAEPQRPVEEAQPRPVMGPNGPIVFKEMDDSPFGDG